MLMMRQLLGLFAVEIKCNWRVRNDSILLGIVSMLLCLEISQATLTLQPKVDFFAHM